jgi:hypothetical protein
MEGLSEFEKARNRAYTFARALEHSFEYVAGLVKGWRPPQLYLI